jgi:preprotein translocase subunit SecG
MKQIFNIIEIVLSAVLIAAILLQNRGSGLGGVFGGEGNVYRTKRGFEKILFTTTIVVSVLFFGAAIANILFVNK